jgi:hypothetical protein
LRPDGLRRDGGSEVLMARILTMAIAVALSGCSAITDIGQFNFRDRDDLTLTLENLAAHEAEVMRILVTRREDVAIEFAGTLFAVDQGVAPPDDRESLELVFPSILENDVEYDVILHAETVDQNGVFDMDEPVYGAEVDDSGEVTIRAETPGSFDAPINTLGNGFVDLGLRNFSPHVGVEIQHFVLMVVDVEESRPVGYARLPDVPGLDFDVFLSNVVTEGRAYRLEFYVDNDGNGVFSGPGNAADHSWWEMRTATVDGVALVFEHRTPFQPLDFVR